MAEGESNWKVILVFSLVFGLLWIVLFFVWWYQEYSWWYYLIFVVVSIALGIGCYIGLRKWAFWSQEALPSEEMATGHSKRKIDPPKADAILDDVLRLGEADYFDGTPQKELVNVGQEGKEQTEFRVKKGKRYYDSSGIWFLAIDLADPSRIIISQYKDRKAMLDALNRAAKHRESVDEYESYTSVDPYGNPVKVNKVRKVIREDQEAKKQEALEQQGGML